jgi:hypothetical protein
MRVYHILIAIAVLLLLAGVSNATLIPDQNSTISSNTVNNFVVVAHQAIITVYAYNSTAQTPVPGATVTLALNSTLLGTLPVSSGVTDGNGMMNGTFSAGTKTGAVNITATITYNNNGNITTVTKVLTQKIDHDVAQNAVFYFQNQVTVGSETPFNISFTDQYGNPIDNRNPADPHTISLWISASDDGIAAFNISGIHSPSCTPSLDANGNISLSVITDTVPYGNEIVLNTFQNVGLPDGIQQYIWGISDGTPCSIVETITPSTLIEPADNQPDHIFSITDTLYDKYGNPTQNQGVEVQSNYPGDPTVNMTTNTYGQVIFTYGPHSGAGYVTLTGTAISNTSTTTSQTVQFYSTSPVNMKFSATPQVMPSLDATPGQIANLTATVTDLMGNPVSNQTVIFSIGVPSYTYPNCVIAGPQLLNTTAVTDSNGNANVMFKPGKFDTNKANVSYDPTDTGSVVVTATWDAVQQPIQMTWKNYPYLSELTTITSSTGTSTVPVNGTFYVTISLSADGFNLTGKPADVVIVTDLAGGVGGPELLEQTQPAEKGFINNATNDTYIGLVTFGNFPVPGNKNCPPYYTTCSAPYASNDTINLWNQQLANNSSKPFNPYGNVWDYDMVNPADWITSSGGIWHTMNDCFVSGVGSGQYCLNATNPKGNYYFNINNDAAVEAHLVNAGSLYPANRANLTTTVNNYYSFGGTDYAAGLNAAMNELKLNGNPTHNQSIIIMGDGINMMAPIANGSTESYWPSDWYPRSNLGYFDESDIGKNAALASATLAKNMGITIYAIGFQTDDIYNNPEEDTAFFTQLPSPGGYYFAPTPTQMSSIFNQIEGSIQYTAGVNTTMAINLQNVYVNYNNATTEYNGTQVFNYVYNPPTSTQITNQQGNTNVTNQTSQWLQNQTLIFNIGTMTTGQTWSTTFEMQLLKPGTVSAIGNQSSLTFGTGESEIIDSGNQINGVENYSNTGFNMPTISITNLQVLQNNTITNVVPLQWNISYPGSQYASETLYYYSAANPTQKFLYQEPPVNPGNWTQDYSWDVSSLPAGEYYVLVQATSHDTLMGKEILPTPIELGESAKAFIKLQ